MKHLELNMKKRVLLVELPKDSIIKSIDHAWKELHYKTPLTNEYHIERWSFPHDRRYSIIGKLSDLKEEDFAELVEKTDNPFHYGQGFRFIKYGTDDQCTETAKESFESAVEAAGYSLKNPFDDRKLGMTFASEYQNRWQIAETQTFHPEHTYIFEILN